MVHMSLKICGRLFTDYRLYYQMRAKLRDEVDKKIGLGNCGKQVVTLLHESGFFEKLGEEIGGKAKDVQALPAEGG